jgi:hypothetical protein
MQVDEARAMKEQMEIEMARFEAERKAFEV